MFAATLKQAVRPATSVFTRAAFAPAQRLFANKSKMASVKVGDAVPEATLMELQGDDMKKIDTKELFANKKVVLFGVPGAFTPGCTKTHLPGYVQDVEKLKGKGVQEIVCVSVNDPFVMKAWGQANGADGKVRMLADPTADFAKKLGVAFDAPPVLGFQRSKRFSALVENGTISQLNVEPDNTGLTCSLSSGLKL